MSKFPKFLSVALIGATVVTATQFALPAFAEPEAVKIVAPEYPRGAERRKIEGSVLIEFTILADGSTQNPTIVEADPAGVFDAAAIQAVQKWKFQKSDVEHSGIKKKLRFQIQ